MSSGAASYNTLPCNYGQTRRDLQMFLGNVSTRLAGGRMDKVAMDVLTGPADEAWG